MWIRRGVLNRNELTPLWSQVFSSVREAGFREDGVCKQMCWSTCAGAPAGWGHGQGLDSLVSDQMARLRSTGLWPGGVQRPEMLE